MGGAVTAVANLLTAVGVPSALASTLAGAAIRLGASALISAVTRRRQPKGTADKGRELSWPSDLVPYRFAYGDTLIQGSPAPWRVRGDNLYGCLILNSRPSAAVTEILLDARAVKLSGNLNDFSGPGASATNEPFAGHATFWVGLGDQTAPPAQILTEAPDLFKSSDGWRGCTVLWCRFKAGDPDDRSERWPAAPPEIKVRGRWSRVWDPRVAGQSADDASTWEFSRNQGLIALDALMRNPVRPYRLDNLLLASFIDAANVADNSVARNSGGPELRYSADGLIVWTDAELLDQLAPIFEAGASRPMRLGGRLGLIPGAMRDTVLTVDDVLDDDGMAFRRWAPTGELPTSMRVRYVNRDRGHELAELQPWPIPGALAEDGGLDRPQDVDLEFVTSATQAMRIRKILGLRARQQRKITAVLPPSAYNAVGGSIVSFGLPAPYGRLNGLYEVQSAQPAVTPAPGDGVHLAVAVEAIEHPASIYAYDPATDEEKIYVDTTFEATVQPLLPPVPAGAVTGQSAALQYGDARVPQIVWSFEPSPSPSVTGYIWELFEEGEDVIAQRGTLAARPKQPFDIRTPVEHGKTYRMTIRATAGQIGIDRSAPVSTGSVMGLGPSISLDAPSAGGVEQLSGELRVTFVAPNSPDVQSLQLYAGSNADPVSAAPVGLAVFSTGNAGRVWTVSVPSGATRHFWARAQGPFGVVSPLSVRQSGTAA